MYFIGVAAATAAAVAASSVVISIAEFKICHTTRFNQRAFGEGVTLSLSLSLSLSMCVCVCACSYWRRRALSV